MSKNNYFMTEIEEVLKQNGYLPFKSWKHFNICKNNKKTEQVRLNVPEVSGVYIIENYDQGFLGYIGEAKNLQVRLIEHINRLDGRGRNKIKVEFFKNHLNSTLRIFYKEVEPTKRKRIESALIHYYNLLWESYKVLKGIR
jgi:hypothetical protein